MGAISTVIAGFLTFAVSASAQGYSRQPFIPRPAQALSFENALALINAYLLGRSIDCSAVSEEDQERSFWALRAEQVRTCGAAPESDDARDTPPERARRACYYSVYQRFDNRPYYDGLQYIARAAATISNGVGVGQPITERVSSHISLVTSSESTPNAQLTIDHRNQIKIDAALDLTTFFSSKSIEFDPVVAIDQPTRFPAIYTSVFFPRLPGSANRIREDKLNVDVIVLTCRLR